MSMLSNIFGSKGFPMPDVHVNSKAFDELSIVKRMYDRILTAKKDLGTVKNLPKVYSFENKNITRSNSMTEGQSDLSNFIAAISNNNGFAKQNWFKVFITSPHQSGVERELSMFCEGTEIPSGNIMTSPLKTYGPQIELPYARAYEPINMVFLIDSNMRMKQFFDNWLNFIIDDSETGNNDVNYMRNYQSTIYIFQLSPNDSNIVHTTTLIGAYPKVVSALPVKHSSTDFHNLQVQFVYEKLITSISDTTKPVLSEQTQISSLMRSVAGLDEVSSASFISEDNPFGANIEQFSIEAQRLKSNILGKAAQFGNVTETVKNVTSIFE